MINFWLIAVGVKIRRMPGLEVCGMIPVDGTHGQSIMIMFVTFEAYVPTAVMLFCYVAVLGKAMSDFRHRKDSRMRRRRLDIAWTLCRSCLWHCIAVYPLSLCVLFYPNQLGTDFSLQWGLSWLTYNYGAFNPVIHYSSEWKTLGMKIVQRQGSLWNYWHPLPERKQKSIHQLQIQLF